MRSPKRGSQKKTARKKTMRKQATKLIGAPETMCKVPPFGRRSHKLTHAQARRARERYIRKYPGRRSVLAPGAYGRQIFDAILKQRGCVGVRFYPGLDEYGKLTVLFCGVDGRGNDMLAGIIGDMPFRCPPYCTSPNGILWF